MVLYYFSAKKIIPSLKGILNLLSTLTLSLFCSNKCTVNMIELSAIHCFEIEPYSFVYYKVLTQPYKIAWDRILIFPFKMVQLSGIVCTYITHQRHFCTRARLFLLNPFLTKFQWHQKNINLNFLFCNYITLSTLYF